MQKDEWDHGLLFGSYHLTGPTGQLLRRKRPLALSRKAMAVLWTLAGRAGHLVSKEALLSAVWPETIVSEGVITNCIGELRRALGDNAKTPRYIETVHRMGYRFIGAVAADAAPVSRSTFEVPGSPSPSPSNIDREERASLFGTWNLKPETLLVGRETELAQLHKLFEKALQGERQIVFVAGEAGIGKTTLLETFLVGIRQPATGNEQQADRKTAARSLLPDSWISWGQCIEHYGAGEAYLPVLEAVERLCRQAEGDRAVHVLRQHAPSWLAQLPALLPEAKDVMVQQRMADATRERMLREIATTLEALSVLRPVVLVLEDLHWSDMSTLDLLSMLARRREPAQLLILATYRLAEAIVHNHPLWAVKQELATRELAVEILLSYLPAEAVQRYVTRQAESLGAIASELGPLIYARTEGQPLFMVQLTAELVQNGRVRPAEWDMLPPGLQQLLAAQIERLTPTEQEILKAGSVAGATFSAASVAAGVGRSIDEIETLCEQLAQQGQFLTEQELGTWPDGTVSGCYGFRHALYQEVLYQRLSASRRARLHLQIGLREEAAYGERAQEIAAELAMHFERGQDKERAIRYLQQAGENALRRNASPEAITLLTHGLDLLATLPKTDKHARQELQLLLTLAPTLIASKGQSTAEVEHIYTRALDLCHHLKTPHQRITVLAGLRRVYGGRGDYAKAQALGEELLELVQQEPDPALFVEAHYSLGIVLFYQGEFLAARTHLTQAFGHDTPQHIPTQISRYGTASGLIAHGYASLVLWVLGYLEQAQQHLQAVLTQAQELAHPLSLGQTFIIAGIFHHLQRQTQMIQGRAEALITLSTEQDLRVCAGAGMIFRGWALVEQGRLEDGSTQLQQGMPIIHVAGTAILLPYFLLLQAESSGTSGQPAQGLRTLDEALQLVERMGGNWCAAELWRLKGELLLNAKRGMPPDERTITTNSPTSPALPVP